MTKIIVLFKLKEGASKDDYEKWARSTDLPMVRNLKSVDHFEVFRSRGLFGSDGAAPYDYIEIISVNNDSEFNQEVGSEMMGKVAEQFGTFAENPQFILTNSLDDLQATYEFISR